jgi:hypothetical protein
MECIVVSWTQADELQETDPSHGRPPESRNPPYPSCAQSQMSTLAGASFQRLPISEQSDASNVGPHLQFVAST